MATVTAPKAEDKKVSEQMKFKRDKDRVLVKGKFIFHEVPGGKLEFPFRGYEGDEITNYSFTDGEIIETPLGVAKHLNTNVCYPSYVYKDDSNGRPVTTINQYIRRCSFQSLEFLDIEGIAPVGSPISPVVNV